VGYPTALILGQRVEGHELGGAIGRGLAGLLAAAAVGIDVAAHHLAHLPRGFVGDRVLHPAGLVVGRLVVELKVLHQEGLQDVVPLADLPRVDHALLGQGHAAVLLVVDQTVRGEDLDHLAHAGGGDPHVRCELGGLGDAAVLGESEDVYQVVLAVHRGHGCWEGILTI
jgi:hypothetical protein